MSGMFEKLNGSPLQKSKKKRVGFDFSIEKSPKMLRIASDQCCRLRFNCKLIFLKLHNFLLEKNTIHRLLFSNDTRLIL